MTPRVANIPVDTMHTFTKEERLRSKQVIDRLFSSGQRTFVAPFQVLWVDDSIEQQLPARVLIGVSRRKIKKAVSRNLLKRRIREAYRKNKKPFYDYLNANGKFCSFALVYSSSRIAEYKDIEEKIILILERLQKEYEKDNQ